MTDQVQNEMPLNKAWAEGQSLTPDQAYLQAVLEKFNTDPNDPTLQKTEKILLSKIQVVQRDISELTKEVDRLNNEIRERQDKGQSLVEQIMHKQGQSQAYIDSLLSLSYG